MELKMKKTIKKAISAFLICTLMLCVLCSCGKTDGDTVSVQSVAMVTGMGNVGLVSRYAGVVVSGKSVDITLDENMKLDELFVEEGQEVSVGETLFTYDNEALLLTLEQSALEIEGMKNSLDANRKQVEELTKERDKASEANKLEYTLQIQTLQADIREAEYNIKLKEKELAHQQETSANTEVKSELNGRITALNPDGGYDNYGNVKPFLTILETGDLRIKGTINEMNRDSLYEGMQVVIRSRTTDEAWTGSISMIDWENPTQGNENYYYGPVESAEMTSSSNYPFYIAVDDNTGMFIGQHVYIEPGELSETGENTMALPSYFINDVETKPWVWAADSKDKLEKRNITIGEYDAENDTYVIESGLDADDYIAFPDETLKAGLPVEKYDESMFDSGDYYAEDVYTDGEFYAEAPVGEVAVEMPMPAIGG